MRRANPQPHSLGGLRRLLRAAVRQPGHLARVLARLRMRAKVRRQDKTETRLP